MKYDGLTVNTCYENAFGMRTINVSKKCPLAMARLVGLHGVSTPRPTGCCWWLWSAPSTHQFKREAVGASFGIEDQMSKWLLIASLVISVGGSSALAEDQRNVTIVNGTGYGIEFLRFNNPGDNEWSDNELPPNSVLPDGNGVYVKFNTADDGCTWNFKIE
jgi:hypothetical protein